MSVNEAQARVSGADAQQSGRNAGDGASGAETFTATTGQTKAEESSLTEAVVERCNLWLTYRKVIGNRGAPGVDKRRWTDGWGDGYVACYGDKQNTAKPEP